MDLVSVASHAACGRKNWPGGAAPMDPRKAPPASPRTKTVLVKFRTTEAQKTALQNTAVELDETVSELLRRVAIRETSGSSTDKRVRAEMAQVRQLANQFSALLAECDALDSVVRARAIDVTDALRNIARRHLGAFP